MSTWVLVLTIAGYTTNSGVAIHSIPGFKSREECISSAQLWLDQRGKGTPQAICMEQKK